MRTSVGVPGTHIKSWVQYCVPATQGLGARVDLDICWQPVTSVNDPKGQQGILSQKTRWTMIEDDI